MRRRRRRNGALACEDGLREQSHSEYAETLSAELHSSGIPGQVSDDLRSSAAWPASRRRTIGA